MFHVEVSVEKRSVVTVAAFAGRIVNCEAKKFGAAEPRADPPKRAEWLHDSALGCL